MAKLTEAERSERSRKAAQTRRENQIAEENKIAEEKRQQELKTTSSSNLNRLLWVIIVILALVVLIIWKSWVSKAAVPIEAPKVASTEAPVIQSTSAAVQNSLAQVEVPTGPVLVSEPNPTCPGWNTDKNVSQWLPPNQTAIGDVKVNGEIQYDNGSGESTIVVNLSSKDVDIFAEFGSGCEFTTDVKSVVDKQLYAGCGDADNNGIVDGCDSVRVVLITDLGTEVKFVTPTDK